MANRSGGVNRTGHFVALAAAHQGAAHWLRAPWEFIGQTTDLGWSLGPTGPVVTGALAWGFAAVVRGFGRGSVPAESRLSGAREPVVVAERSRRSGAAVTKRS